MLDVNNVGISFAGEFLFQNVSFRVDKSDRIGLIGKNGAGKSTLLKIIAKDLLNDVGTISKPKSVTIGFLRQDIEFENGRTLLNECYTAFTALQEIKFKIDEINNSLVERTDYESEGYNDLIMKLTELNDEFSLKGGFNYQGETEKILLGLGFKREEFNKLTEEFSGGWRMRIELAKLLLQNHDILLLDEPTNHLDIDSIIWLENFLINYAGAVILVSHDKVFLDNTSNRTIEVLPHRIFDYKKSYSDFVAFRKEQIELQASAQKNQAKEIKRTEQLIDRFRAKASKATMAQSLQKRLDKIDVIQVDEMTKINLKIDFPVSVQPGKIIMELNQVSKSYGEKEVLKNVDLIVERNDKIALIGKNGQGKSTLAKIITNEIEFTGNFKNGHNVKYGYFAQNQAEELDGSKTVLDTMIDASDDKTRTKVRDMLGAFLFSGDDASKKVKVLSGGERNRLALCKLLLEPFNVLLMDEPTNHLDIQSKDILKQALMRYEGTLIVISHDRDFLKGLTNKVYEFADKNIKEYFGDIDEYLEVKKIDELRKAVQSDKVSSAKTTKDNSQLDYKSQKKQKSLKNRLSKTEASISDLEKELKNLDFELASNYEVTIAKENFFDDYNAKKQHLEKLMQDWEDITIELEEL